MWCAHTKVPEYGQEAPREYRPKVVPRNRRGKLLLRPKQPLVYTPDRVLVYVLVLAPLSERERSTGMYTKIVGE